MTVTITGAMLAIAALALFCGLAVGAWGFSRGPTSKWEDYVLGGFVGFLAMYLVLGLVSFGWLSVRYLAR